jgi:hypothetical protein
VPGQGRFSSAGISEYRHSFHRAPKLRHLDPDVKLDRRRKPPTKSLIVKHPVNTMAVTPA